MEIHFYERSDLCPDSAILHCDWAGTETALRLQHGNVHTTQMGLLSSLYLCSGHRVFIHPAAGEPYEVTLKGPEADPDRSVRPSQNMFRMWAGGIFNK